MLTALAAALAALVLFPETPAGQALRRWLVDAPARALNRLRRGHAALAIGLVLLIAAAVALGREGMFVMMTGPEFVAWFAAFDIATYVEVIAAALAMAAAVRLRAGLASGRLATARLWRACRSLAGRRRTRRRWRRPRPRSNPPADPESGTWPAGLALA